MAGELSRQPYWAHFQTTDVHEPFRPQAPFAGLFIDPERRDRHLERDDALEEMPGGFRVPGNYEALGITVEQHALAQQVLQHVGDARRRREGRRLDAVAEEVREQLLPHEADEPRQQDACGHERGAATTLLY